MLQKHLLLLLSFLSIGLSAQINTGNPSKPFGSNNSYEYGIIPTNQTTNDTDIQTEYNNWKTKYVENCGTDKARVKFDDPSQTVSEGIAYGMLLAVYAADKDLFDRLWAYYKSYRNSNGVMHWKINGCNSVNSQNGATDAELDAAMALIVASKQWATTNPHNYKTDGVALINAIRTTETSQTDYTFYNGDMWHPDCRNPSYQAPAYARAFKLFMAENGANQNTFWDNVAKGTETLLINNAHSTSGLPTNWCTPAGPPNNSCSGSGTAPDKFGYDACRAPWREGVDVIWWGPTATGQMQSIINRQCTFWSGKGGASTVQGSNNMNWDGSGSGDHTGAFTGPIGAMTLGATNNTSNQSLCNALYTENKKTSMDNSYFGGILRMIGLFVQSGNFWNPYASQVTIPTNQNPTVSLTSPINNSSICSGNSITITANASDSDGTISKVEFYNGTTLINTDNTSPYSFDYTPTTSGSFSFTAKAFDDKSSTTTSTSISVTVNNSPTAPSTGSSTINYCLNSNATQLTANGTSLKWYTQATGGNSSNSAPIPSTSISGPTSYYVSQTVNNCESARTQITVNINETNTPTTPNQSINYCQNQTAVQLTANGTNLKWYTQASGGSSTSSAPTPTTSTIKTTDYYVSQTLNTCESARLKISVIVGAATNPPSVNSSIVEYCQNATASSLTATGSNLKWYTMQSGGTSQSSITPNTTTVGESSYYVSQTVGGCESQRTVLKVKINTSPNTPTTSDTTYLINATPKTLKAIASGTLKWYTQANGGSSSTNAPTPNTSTPGTTNYYVSQTVGTCESPRATIKINVVDALLVGKTSVAPTIDGTIDAIWSRVQGQAFSNVIQGSISNSNDLSGSFKTLWDDNYLYILGEISDDILINDSPNSYDDDAVEVYFDYANNKPTSYQANDVQYTFGYNDGNTIGVSNDSSKAGITYKINTTTAGYTFETRIPWSTLGGIGKIGDFHGFEFQVNDDDNNGNRDGKLAWTAKTDDAWQNPSLFGTIMLGDMISICDQPSKPIITSTKTTACEGESITITSSVSNSSNFSVQWLNGTNIINNQSGTNLNVAVSGQYSVRYYSVDPNNSNCYNTSNPINITISPKPITPTIIGANKACIYSSTEIYNYSVNKNTGSTYQWTSTNSTIISGNGSSNIALEFSKSFQATTGTINVIETNKNNCISSKSSLTITYDCPNATIENTNTLLKVYPNPFQDQLFIDGYNTYEVIDAKGIIITKGQIQNGTIDTSDLKNGIYFLKVNNISQIDVFKILKE